MPADDTDQDDDRFRQLFAGAPGSLLGDAASPSEPAADGPAVPEADPRREAAKVRRAEERRGLTGAVDPAHRRRLPPGQSRVDDWPVLDLGKQPLIPQEQWQLSVAGAVERPLKWSWAEFLAQPQTEVSCDLHCVTQWSRFDNVFRGVAVRHLLACARPRPTARFAVLHGHDGYTTNVPLALLGVENALIAHTWRGKPLERAHGGPVRLLLPDLYLWKSAKWLRHIVLLEKDAPGYWESRGYHREGDPWREQRYE